MTPKFQTLHPRFVAEVSPVDLRLVHDRETLGEIREGMDEYAVLVFRDQPLTDAEQLDFGQRLDGQLHARTGAATIGNNRLGDESLTDISNVDETGKVLAPNDRRRMYGLGNRLWRFHDLGQPRDDAPRAALRRYEASSRVPPRDDARHRA